MAGCTDDRMAEALEAAQVVVVCVSRMYKERPNCRMEAKYANQLFKKGKLQILYVMMQRTYTTVSEPDSCDGWLGIQIGDALWYPLWDESTVGPTADSLLTIIGDRCKAGDNSRRIANQQASSTPAPSTTTADPPLSPTMPAKLRTSVSGAAIAMELTQDDICLQAWEILSDPKKALNMAELSAYIEEIGLLEAADLKDCDKDILLSVSAFLKPVQRKKFERLMLNV